MPITYLFKLFVKYIDNSNFRYTKNRVEWTVSACIGTSPSILKLKRVIFNVVQL